MSSHYIGDTVEKQVTFRNTDGALANPSVVNANAKDPTGASRTGSTSNQSTGVWDALYDADVVGIWFYRIEGEGNEVNTVVEGSFCVKGSSVE